MLSLRAFAASPVRLRPGLTCDPKKLIVESFIVVVDPLAAGSEHEELTMNFSRKVDRVCSGSRLIEGFHGLRLWGIAFFCVLSATVLANAAEEPRHLKEIARSKGHDDGKGSTIAIGLGHATVAFSPAGKKAATAAWNGTGKGTVKVWEIPTLKELNTIEVEERIQIPCVAWSADGRFLAACLNKSALGPDDKVRRRWSAHCDRYDSF
jgi:WD40 repeat protein